MHLRNPKTTHYFGLDSINQKVSKRIIFIILAFFLIILFRWRTVLL
jgi:hypothetical protein